MKPFFDVVGVDMPCIDLNLNINTFPQPNGGARVNQLSWQGGGKVATGMVAAARQGARCAMLGAAGDDIFGCFCVDDFNRHGIDTESFAVRKGESTSLSVVLSDRETGGRSFVFRPGSAPRYQMDDFDLRYLRSTRYFFICSADEDTLTALYIARESGARVVVDSDQYSERMMTHIDQLDYFIASEFVYNHLFKDDDYEKNARFLLRQGPKAVLFTLGDQGCAGVSEEGYFRLPAYPVDVVDTVGAGDVFHGAFIAAMLDNCSVKEAALRASATAAIKCTCIGGRAGIPNRRVLFKFMKTGTINYGEIDRRIAFYKNLAVDYHMTEVFPHV